MRRGFGLRFLIVGVLILLMFIPLFLVAEVVGDRRHLSRETVRKIGEQWGGDQVLSGPRLVIPVQEEIERIIPREVIDPSTGRPRMDAEGKQPLMREDREVVTVRRAPIIIYPETLEVTVDLSTEIRHRGIFTAPVYQGRLAAAFSFDPNLAPNALRGKEVILWDAARIELYLSSNKALRGVAQLSSAGTELRLEPNDDARSPGIIAQIGDPRDMSAFDLSLGLNGAGELKFAPVGRQTDIKITSDWPHPSFQGAFLPDSSEIGETGFSAQWAIPHLARPLPQVSREDFKSQTRGPLSFGVSFYEPNDFYQKAFRAARYGILYIALTFLTVLLIDRGRDRPVHPVQYLLIGLAQASFVLLMVAYAEQIGFGPAYGIAAGAVTVLLTLFGWAALGMGRRSLLLGAMLVLVYAVLFLILQSADYALLAGATLTFLAIAVTMFATRNEDWYGGGAIAASLKSSTLPAAGQAVIRKSPAPDRAEGGQGPEQNAEQGPEHDPEQNAERGAKPGGDPSAGPNDGPRPEPTPEGRKGPW